MEEKTAAVFAAGFRIDIEFLQLTVLAAVTDGEIEGDAGDSEDAEFVVFRDIDTAAGVIDQGIERLVPTLQDRAAVQSADKVDADIAILRHCVAYMDAHPPATPCVLT